MSLAFAPFATLVENAGTVRFALPAFNAEAAGTMRFALPVFDATPDNYMQLPLPAFTEAGPVATTITVSGGALVSGGASIVGDPLIRCIASGGALLAGSATVVDVSVLRYELYPLGGVSTAGTATVSWAWKQYDMSGGALVGGTATVTTTDIGTNSSAASLPILSAEFSGQAVKTAVAQLDAALPGTLGAFAGVAGCYASMSCTAAALRGDFIGGVLTLDGKLGAVTAVFQAATASNASLDALLGYIDGSFSAYGILYGDLAADLVKPVMTSDGYTGVTATLSETLPLVQAVYALNVGTSSWFAGTVAPLSASYAGQQRATAALAAELAAVKSDMMLRSQSWY